MKGIEPNRSRKKLPSTIGVAVLLVEDHEPTRLAVTRLLHRRHYKVISASSCAQARSLIQKNDDFRVLISDVGLPDGSGYDLMAEFKQKFGTNGIALTGLGREEDVERSQASGFTSHLTKPVSVEALEIAVAATLQIIHSFVRNREDKMNRLRIVSEPRASYPSIRWIHSELEKWCPNWCPLWTPPSPNPYK